VNLGPSGEPVGGHAALTARAEALIADVDVWAPYVRHDPERRCYDRIVATPTYDAWLIGWSPGQAIPAHDHGTSTGAVIVTDGQLVETRGLQSGSPQVRTLRAGEPPHVVGAEHVHALANLTSRHATSLHLYAPPLSSMRYVDRADAAPRVRPVTRHTSHGRSIADLLDAARARIQPVGPADAHSAVAAGALLVDIRPEASRRAEGEIPGALVVDRNVLEWRLDPASPDKLPEVTGYDQSIIVVCNEGYASSLAAATLVDLGLVHATDLAGGYRAWRRAGLPTVAAPGD